MTVQQAAEQGWPEAQYEMALRYANGEGVAQDHSEAARWYEASARQGFADAQNNLGAMYLEQGKAAEALAALTRAVELYTTAVKDEAGLARAHYNVALVCEAQGKSIEAVAAYEKSLEIRRRIDRAGAARILDSLALLHATAGDLNKAKACREEAAKLRP